MQDLKCISSIVTVVISCVWAAMIKEKKGDCIFIDIKNWIFFAACHETFQLIGISFSVSSQLWHQFSFWFYLHFFGRTGCFISIFFKSSLHKRNKTENHFYKRGCVCTKRDQSGL